MRVPRTPVLLLTATCFLSGCCSLSGVMSTDQAWVGQKGGVSQKGTVVHKGHVHQKGGVHQKGVYQKGVHQKGDVYKSAMHQNLWNHFEPSGCCGGGWDPVLGSCDACGVCGGDCHGHTPAQHLKHKLTCASGCGEIYWGDWISHPPVDCDPCDDWGNYVGPVDCGGPSCLDSLASGWCNLFGYRNGGKGGKGHVGCASCGGKGGGKGGCDTCGDGPPAQYYDVPVEEDGDEVVPTPEIEASHRTDLSPVGTGFSIRSARLTR